MNGIEKLIETLERFSNQGATIWIKPDGYVPAHVRPGNAPIDAAWWRSYLLGEAKMHSDALKQTNRYATTYVNFYIGDDMHMWCGHYRVSIVDGTYTWEQLT